MRGFRLLPETVAGAPPDLHILDLAGGLDTDVMSGASHPGWSPDGRWLAYGTAQGVHLLDPVADVVVKDLADLL